MMRKSAYMATTAVASVGLIAAVVGTSAAVAPGHSAKASSQNETFYINETNGTQIFVADGPVVGGGKDKSHGSIDLLKFSGGTITVKHPNSQGKFTQHLDKKTCFLSFALAGKYTISGGTGDYDGVSGSGTYKGAGQAVLQQSKKGCDTKAHPVAEVSQITASGPLDLP